MKIFRETQVKSLVYLFLNIVSIVIILSHVIFMITFNEGIKTWVILELRLELRIRDL